MQGFVFFAVAGINLFVATIYFWMLIRKRSKPALAMWLFFSLAVVMSLITYLKQGNYSFWDNALNTADLALTVSVTIAILVWGDKSSCFNRFDLVCLLVVAGIILFWIITQNHLVTNMGIQLIMIIAYLPVVKRMLASKENYEPFAIWIALTIAPFISLLTSKGILASIYAFRAIVCSALLLALMVRIERLNRKSGRRPSGYWGMCTEDARREP